MSSKWRHKTTNFFSKILAELLLDPPQNFTQIDTPVHSAFSCFFIRRSHIVAEKDVVIFSSYFVYVSCFVCLHIQLLQFVNFFDIYGQLFWNSLLTFRNLMFLVNSYMSFSNGTRLLCWGGRFSDLKPYVLFCSCGLIRVV